MWIRKKKIQPEKQIFLCNFFWSVFCTLSGHPFLYDFLSLSFFSSEVFPTPFPFSLITFSLHIVRNFNGNPKNEKLTIENQWNCVQPNRLTRWEIKSKEIEDRAVPAILCWKTKVFSRLVTPDLAGEKEQNQIYWGQHFPKMIWVLTIFSLWPWTPGALGEPEPARNSRPVLSPAAIHCDMFYISGDWPQSPLELWRQSGQINCPHGRQGTHHLRSFTRSCERREKVNSCVAVSTTHPSCRILVMPKHCLRSRRTARNEGRRRTRWAAPSPVSDVAEGTGSCGPEKWDDVVFLSKAECRLVPEKLHLKCTEATQWSSEALTPLRAPPRHMYLVGRRDSTICVSPTSEAECQAVHKEGDMEERGRLKLFWRCLQFEEGKSNSRFEDDTLQTCDIVFYGGLCGDKQLTAMLTHPTGFPVRSAAS